MEVDDLSGCPSHNSVNPASDKVINLFWNHMIRGFKCIAIDDSSNFYWQIPVIMCVINLSLLKTLNPVNQPKFVYPNIMYETFFVYMYSIAAPKNYSLFKLCFSAKTEEKTPETT